MIKNTRREVLLVILGLVVSFAFGDYFGRYGSIDEHTSRKIARSEIRETVQRNVRSHTSTRTVKQPDGTVVTDVDTVLDSVSSTQAEETTQKTEETKEVKRKASWNVSALISESTREPGIPSYGIGFQKEFIGPITVGAFGFNNGVVGVSIGLNF